MTGVLSRAVATDAMSAIERVAVDPEVELPVVWGRSSNMVTTLVDALLISTMTGFVGNYIVVGAFELEVMGIGDEASVTFEPIFDGAAVVVGNPVTDTPGTGKGASVASDSFVAVAATSFSLPAVMTMVCHSTAWDAYVSVKLPSVSRCQVQLADAVPYIEQAQSTTL